MKPTVNNNTITNIKAFVDQINLLLTVEVDSLDDSKYLIYYNNKSTAIELYRNDGYINDIIVEYYTLFFNNLKLSNIPTKKIKKYMNKLYSLDSGMLATNNYLIHAEPSKSYQMIKMLRDSLDCCEFQVTICNNKYFYELRPKGPSYDFLNEKIECLQEKILFEIQKFLNYREISIFDIKKQIDYLTLQNI